MPVAASARHPERGATPTPPQGGVRLLSGLGDQGGTVTLDGHLGRWGGLPDWKGTRFLDELDHSGLRGHGGAWFPVGRKWRSVRDGGMRSAVVVANGAEGEPASAKDRLLLRQLPHLVLDGAAVAASGVGASRVILHVPAGAVPVVTAALDERRRAGIDPCPFEIVTAPDRYLAGQESAAVNTVNGRTPAIPSFITLRPVRERGVAGRPTLVQNVETLAHVSLIARFGADWFRQVGTRESPGTALLTVTGRWSQPRVVEAPLGPSLADILGLGPDAPGSVQAVLLGGYGGSWITTADALAMPFSEEGARRVGASLGAGVVALLPTDVCPLLEVARVVRYLEGQGARQCGPCVNGLAVLADTIELLASRPASLRNGVSSVPGLCDLVEGRGACGHPDGVARFVRSALAVFEGHIALHLRRGPCHTAAPPFLPVPAPPSRRRK